MYKQIDAKGTDFRFQ